MPKNEALDTVHAYVEERAYRLKKAFLRLMRIPRLYKKVLGIFAAQTPKLFGISAGFEAAAVRTTGDVAHRYLQRHTGGAGHSGTVRQRDGAVHRRGDRRPAACARCRLRHGLAGYTGHLYQMQLQYQPYSAVFPRYRNSLRNRPMPSASFSCTYATSETLPMFAYTFTFRPLFVTEGRPL